MEGLIDEGSSRGADGDHFAWCDSPSAGLRTAFEHRNGSRRIPKPAANRQTAAELDRELGGLMQL